MSISDVHIKLRTMRFVFGAAIVSLALAIPAGFASAQFDQGRVSITVDDGWQNSFDSIRNAGVFGDFKTTQYIFTDGMNQVHGGIYMDASEVKAMFDDGHEIGGHSKTHSNLVGASSAALEIELEESKADLEQAIDGNVTTFAYPYGAYDNALISAVQNAGYIGARSVDDGLNPEEALTETPYTLMIKQVTAATTNAEINSWIDDALSAEDPTWLILMIHEIVAAETPNADACDSNVPEQANESECITRAVAEGITAYLVETQACVLTVAQVFASTECPTADSNAPVITLNGDATINVTVGDSFADPGATTDDGSTVTSQVFFGADATTTVNTAVVGTYEIRYNSADVAGNNAAQVTRTVNVTETSVTPPPPPAEEEEERPRKRGGSIRRTGPIFGGVVLGAATGPSSGLTDAQIKSVLDVLLSFGVDQKTVDSVTAALKGQGGAASSSLMFTKTLSMGSTGMDVTELQKRLTNEGLYKGPVNGYFGPLTRAAVMAFQKMKSIPATGLVGPMTRAALNGK